MESTEVDLYPREFKSWLCLSKPVSSVTIKLCRIG